MKRIILHADLNHCYAQIEEMKYPHLRNVPMAVGGSEEKRSGIILAKNDLAKEYGIKTAETLRDAKRKCPHLVIVPPNYSDYIYYTEKVKDIYRTYTDRVESFGLDEAWCDLTQSQALFGDGIELAKRIQNEIYEKYGLTVSMGVSFNKIFAKLGSDFDKKSGFAIISEENYKEVVWKLPVEDLLMVGNKTKAKLNAYGIYTIGELANYSLKGIQKKLGVNGAMIWSFANGMDNEEVKHVNYEREVKSVGNSKTVVKDILNFDQLHEVFVVLSESVAARLKDIQMEGKVVSMSLRDNGLRSFSRQRKLSKRTNLSREILDVAFELARENYDFVLPLRSVGINVSDLMEENRQEQLDLFTDPVERDKEKALENVVESIRGKYGYDSCKRCSVLKEKELTDFDPKGTHTVFPVSYR